MSHEAKIHKAQTKILRELLFQPKTNYASLQKQTGLESDHAKFHIKRLLDLGYISRKDRMYSLTPRGKEYANKLDTDTNTIERQPKSSVIMIVCRDDADEKRYIVQQRLKNPYYGFMSFYSGKIRWGESIFETAVRETKEETGLLTEAEDWNHRGIYHEIVRHKNTGEIVEDKVFHIMFTDKFRGKLVKEYEGGKNFWMTAKEAKEQPKRFKSFDIEMRAASRRIPFTEVIDEYDDQEF